VGKIYCKVLASCFDPHTSFFPPAERENFESEMGKSVPKFGFSLSAEEDDIVIENLAPGSAAYKSGQLNPGDKIEKIKWEGKDAVDVAEANQKEISELLSSGNQEKLTLTVRKTDGTLREVVLQKELIDKDLEEEKVQGYILSGEKKIGFVSLPDFYTDWEDKTNSINGCANDLAKEIIRLKKENIDGLILDLRFNGGGSMQEAIDLSGIFIDAGPVGQLKTKDEKLITLKDVNRGMVYDGPLVILVNAFSASASEMVAGTLQDYKRAVIIGSPTFGKGTAQVMMPLDTTIDFSKPPVFKPNSNSIKLTVEHLYRVNGVTVQGKGVIPDIELPDFFQAAGEREKDQILSTPAVYSTTRFSEKLCCKHHRYAGVF
jgi:carboxyl-terminal processing protease